MSGIKNNINQSVKEEQLSLDIEDLPQMVRGKPPPTTPISKPSIKYYEDPGEYQVMGDYSELESGPDLDS